MGDLLLQPADLTTRAARDRWLAVQNRVWPEFAETDAEFAHEVTQAGPRRTWHVVEPATGADVGALQVERIRWNDDAAPPLAFLMLDAAAETPDRYRQLLAPCGDWARGEGFSELRVYAWERDSMLLATCLEQPGWREVERHVDVQLDLGAAPTAPAARRAPAGIEVHSFADRPDLMHGAWAALCAALPDIPGDEPDAIPKFEAWVEDHAGPQYWPEARFAAVDTATGEVVGLGELELPELQVAQGVGWHGFTAVHPAARRRGVALALKQATIAWARAQGLHYLRTENEARNEPMRRLNAELGYEPAPARVVLRGPIGAALL